MLQDSDCGERRATALYARRDHMHRKATHGPSSGLHPSQQAQRRVGSALWEKPCGGADRISESSGWRRVCFWLVLPERGIERVVRDKR